MDLLTQGVLGAAIGQVGFQQRLGKRAILFGGLAGLLPDADVLWVLASNDFMAMETIHRGLTHSLFFAPMLAVPTGIFLSSLDTWINRIKAKKCISSIRLQTQSLNFYANKIRLKDLIYLSFWALLTHPLLDLFTTFGTQLLAPFSSHRFALSAIPIVDPVYTLPLICSIFFGLLKPAKSFIVASTTLFLTSTYLFVGLLEHDKAINKARDYCIQNNLTCNRIEAFPIMPTLFAHRLWIESKDSIHITEYSTWTNNEKKWLVVDKKNIPTSIKLHSFYKTYMWFTNGITIAHETKHHGFCLIDSRYGSLEHKPLGVFNICFEENKTVRNIEYMQNDLTSNFSLTFFQKVKRYTQLIKETYSWTFRP